MSFPAINRFRPKCGLRVLSVLWFALGFVHFSTSRPEAAICTVPSSSHPKIQSAVSDSSCNTVKIRQGTYQENVTVSRNVRIQGTGNDLTFVDGTASGSVFVITPQIKVVINDLNIFNGKANEGGGIHNRGDLTLNRVIVRENKAASGSRRYGGGIYSTHALTATDTQILLNDAGSGSLTGRGGGIYCNGKLVLLRAVIKGNKATFGYGESGAIYAKGLSWFSITDSEIVENTSKTNAAIYLDSANQARIINTDISRNEPSALSIPHFIGSTTATRLLIHNSTISKNGPRGGISALRSAQVLINESKITDNTNSYYPGTSYSGASGGGIRNLGGMIVRRSVISGNFADHNGGGISNTGNIAIDESTIAKNTADHTQVNAQHFVGLGGGFYNSPSGEAVVARSTISENFASSLGGGIANAHNLWLLNATISRNTAGEFGGGIAMEDSSAYNSGMMGTHLTVYENQAPEGGGFYLEHRPPGGSPTVELYNSIVAKNGASDCKGNLTNFNSFNHNLDSDNTCQLTQPNDKPGQNPQLGPLANNGGRTWTHRPLSCASPVIDAASDILKKDQRWKNRPVLACGNLGRWNSDIGAFELQQGE